MCVCGACARCARCAPPHIRHSDRFFVASAAKRNEETLAHTATTVELVHRTINTMFASENLVVHSAFNVGCYCCLRLTALATSPAFPHLFMLLTVSHCLIISVSLVRIESQRWHS